ncbi:MAG: peptidylprolyl isomerase [Alphaproteobacteria bacterium]|nr:peptidylprolyl isomerase [Alphaproteobacteria bacterium]
MPALSARFGRVLAAVLLLSIVSVPASAQSIQRIAAVVNDEIISVRDLANRTRLVVAISKLPNTQQTFRRLRPQVLRLLIDEQLQLQEAKRLSISISDRDIDVGKGLMENRFRVRKGSFDSFLSTNRIDSSSAIIQIRASIAWSKLVNRRFANTAEVSEEEIDEVIDQFQRNLGKPQYLAAEILLPVDDPENEREVRQLADRLLTEIKKGGNFNAIAQQFSASASAATGGRIGWISPGQLASELEAPLQALKTGEVSEPIRTILGYHILKLENRRILSAADPMKANVTLKHVFLPLPAGSGEADVAAQLGIAEAVAASVQNCDDMNVMAKEVQSPAGVDLGKFKVGELAPAMRNAIAKLDTGIASKPVRLPTGVSVMMVCERVEPPSNIPQRDEIKPRLRARKLDILARRYLRDLRRDAFIESRI